MPASAPNPDSPTSNEQQIVGAIPARFGSTRLPGKPLRLLAGRPLIEHVYRRASQAEGLDRVVVLTDDERIVEAVERFGGEVQLTPRECASGTDRIAVAARTWRATALVNIQGDEPLIDPQAIARLAAHLRARPDDPVVTLAAPASAADRNNPNIVKVVVGVDGRALYFSRSPIPYSRERRPEVTLRHLGIYGYQRQALLQWAELAPSPLEQSESLEQLRALENGIAIRVLRVEHAWQGVDTMDDLEAVERILQREAENSAREASR